jgi:hypothetical protein
MILLWDRQIYFDQGGVIGGFIVIARWGGGGAVSIVHEVAPQVLSSPYLSIFRPN